MEPLSPYRVRGLTGRCLEELQAILAAETSRVQAAQLAAEFGAPAAFLENRLDEVPRWFCEGEPACQETANLTNRQLFALRKEPASLVCENLRPPNSSGPPCRHRKRLRVGCAAHKRTEAMEALKGGRIWDFPS